MYPSSTSSMSMPAGYQPHNGNQPHQHHQHHQQQQQYRQQQQYQQQQQQQQQQVQYSQAHVSRSQGAPSSSSSNSSSGSSSSSRSPYHSYLSFFNFCRQQIFSTKMTADTSGTPEYDQWIQILNMVDSTSKRMKDAANANTKVHEEPGVKSLLHTLQQHFGKAYSNFYKASQAAQAQAQAQGQGHGGGHSHSHSSAHSTQRAQPVQPSVPSTSAQATAIPVPVPAIPININPSNAPQSTQAQYSQRSQQQQQQQQQHHPSQPMASKQDPHQLQQQQQQLAYQRQMQQQQQQQQQQQHHARPSLPRNASVEDIARFNPSSIAPSPRSSHGSLASQSAPTVVVASSVPPPPSHSVPSSLPTAPVSASASASASAMVGQPVVAPSPSHSAAVMAMDSRMSAGSGRVAQQGGGTAPPSSTGPATAASPSSYTRTNSSSSSVPPSSSSSSSSSIPVSAAFQSSHNHITRLAPHQLSLIGQKMRLLINMIDSPDSCPVHVPPIELPASLLGITPHMQLSDLRMKALSEDVARSPDWILTRVDRTFYARLNDSKRLAIEFQLAIQIPSNYPSESPLIEVRPLTSNSNGSSASQSTEPGLPPPVLAGLTHASKQAQQLAQQQIGPEKPLRLYVLLSAIQSAANNFIQTIKQQQQIQQQQIQQQQNQMQHQQQQMIQNQQPRLS